MLHNSLSQDVAAEGSNPTETFTVNNLDGDAVRAFYASVSAAPGRWTVDRNCADLVAQALQVAGLKLTNTQNGNSTPRDVFNLVKSAAAGARFCPEHVTWQGHSGPLRYPK